MYSQTFIGREAFAAIWGTVVLCAAAKEVDQIQFPFDPQLRRFVAAHEKDIAALLRAVERFTGLDDDIMRIASADAPWADAKDQYRDRDSLKMELVLASLEPSRLVGTNAFDRTELNLETIREACADQLERLLEALISGRWSFFAGARSGNEKWSEFANSLEELLSHLSPILHHIGLTTGSLLSFVFHARWMPAYTSGRFESEIVEFRAYIEAWASYMART